MPALTRWPSSGLTGGVVWWDLRQMDFRAQTTTSPLVGEVYAVLKSSPERLEEGRKKKRREKNTISSACCLLKEVQYSLLSLWYHGCVGQDPVNCGYSSVDVFRESCRWVEKQIGSCCKLNIFILLWFYCLKSPQWSLNLFIRTTSLVRILEIQTVWLKRSCRLVETRGADMKNTLLFKNARRQNGLLNYSCIWGLLFRTVKFSDILPHFCQYRQRKCRHHITVPGKGEADPAGSC